MTTKRILLLTFGSILTLVALALLAGGGALLWVDTKRDADGFYMTSTERFGTTSSHLLQRTSTQLRACPIGSSVPTGSDRFGDVRLRGSSSDVGQEVFIGIGDADAIATYLAGVEQDVVADVDFDPFRATYRRETGSTEPRAPAAETFWEASIQGVGTQTLEWEVEKGTWAAVVMNADASRNVDVDLAVGANIGFIVELGIAFLAGGAVLLLGGATLMFFGTRKRGRNDPTTSKASAPRSRWAWRAATAARAPRFPTKRRM